MAEPAEILAAAFRRANLSLQHPVVADAQIEQRVEYVSKNLSNRAGVRLLMACLLAKLHMPTVDVRKPYTQIGSEDSFSGRSYDGNRSPEVRLFGDGLRSAHGVIPNPFGCAQGRLSSE